MVNRLTMEKWRGEFAAYLAFALGKDVDLTCIIAPDEFVWVDSKVDAMWTVYYIGRMHERCAKACEVAQTRINEVMRVVDSQDVSYSGRGE